ncbi:MAG: 5-deoxy-glucuronate isomerase [Verrucomicrobia bacterium]|nr:5-deoxy-glucuronate isomerase [Verrucomicrobiota bacterium]
MTLANALLPGPRAGFPPGFTAVTRTLGTTPSADAGLEIDFGLLKPSEGEVIAETHPSESAWVLLRGTAEMVFPGGRAGVRRTSVFDEPPTALHLGPGTPVTVRARSADTEWAVVRTPNDRAFAPRLFLPGDITPEYRGAGLVQNAGLRNVRLVFDRTARPESNLVVGEVVNYPGRWSSYPPHHHDQPELYHYRFTHPDGYGHAELGDHVVKVRAHDTVVIPPGLDHAQVSAPGYGMFYLWMIRHLPGNPYTGFTFAEEHKWTLDPAQQGWMPPDLSDA